MGRLSSRKVIDCLESGRSAFLERASVGIPDSDIITLRVESRNKYFLISLDGRSEIFPAGIELKMSKADYTTKVIKRYNHTFYQTLREKLMWGADVRMK